MAGPIREADIPEENLDEAKKYREELFDVLTRHDDKDRITSAYLEGKDVPIDAVRALIREQTLKMQDPARCCAARGREHIGIQPLLDAVCLLPAEPAGSAAGRRHQPRRRKRKRSASPTQGAVRRAGLQGRRPGFTATSSTSASIPARSRRIAGLQPRQGRQGNHRQALPHPRRPDPGATICRRRYAGDIVASIGLKDSVTGDTLCETQHPILLEPITFAEAVVSQSIEPESAPTRTSWPTCSTSCNARTRHSSSRPTRTPARR